jgi:hypothetical protein
LPTFFAPLLGANSFNRMSDFLYRQQMRNSIDHAAILWCVSDLHRLVQLSEAETGHTGTVLLQAAVLALDERYF